MHLKTFAAGAALALVAQVVQANNVSNDITTGLDGDTAVFGVIHSDSADFTDEILIDLPIQLFANVSLATAGTGPHNIDFISAELNGQPLTFSPIGDSETGNTGADPFAILGPLKLVIHGKSGAGGGNNAAYTGTVNVTAAVPEPGTAGLALSALAGLGAFIRRRVLG